MRTGTPAVVHALFAVLTLAACGGGGGGTSRSYVVSTFSDYSGGGWGLTFDGSGNLYLANPTSSRVHRITLAGVSSVYSEDAMLYTTRGVAVDASGNVYACNDEPNNDVIRITPAKVHALYAGTTGSSGSSNTAPVTFSRPYGLALDRTRQVLYLADSMNSKIRKIDMTTGTVSDFASSPFVYGVAVDANGYVYACSSLSNVLQKFTPAGAYDNGYTLSGTPATPQLYAVAVDSHGNMLVTDGANHIVWKIDPEGHAGILAGVAGTAGLVDGPAEAAQFDHPRGIAVDGDDRVYVIDNFNAVIRRIALE